MLTVKKDGEMVGEGCTTACKVNTCTFSQTTMSDVSEIGAGR